MSNATVNMKADGDTRNLTISGSIDESFDYQNLIANSATTYNIDFNDLKMINSCGIREWIRFVEKLGSAVQINYFNCPHIIILQMNMVAGFLSSNAKIQSFYAPYFCEEMDEEHHILLKSSDVVNGKAPVKTIKVDGQDVDLEFDAMEEQYFKFLKKQRP